MSDDEKKRINPAVLGFIGGTEGVGQAEADKKWALQMNEKYGVDATSILLYAKTYGKSAVEASLEMKKLAAPFKGQLIPRFYLISMEDHGYLNDDLVLLIAKTHGIGGNFAVLNSYEKQIEDIVVIYRETHFFCPNGVVQVLENKNGEWMLRSEKK